MKWLILLALVACGKHQEPAALDYHDSDGDQIQNYKESDFDKYVANFESLGEVKGVIRFNTDKLNEIRFTNQHDLDNNTMELMTANEKRIQTQDYFSEWSRVILQDKIVAPSLKLSQYSVQLEFVTGSDKPDEVLLVKGNTSLKLGDWAEVMKPSISSEDLTALSEGNAKLVLVKKFKKLKFFDETDQTIKEKTYRVFYNDSKTTKIFYVSKELEFVSFLEMMKIKKYVPVTEDDYFFNSHLLNETNWYTRELVNGDKIIAKTSFDQLKTKFEQNYTYQKKVISRVNGDVSSVLELKNKPGAKVYLRIRSIQKTMRTFNESVSSRREGGGGGREGNAGSMMCHSYRRNITNETLVHFDFNDVVTQMNHPEFFGQEEIYPEISENGLYFETKAELSNENVKLNFNPLPASTYVQSGEYRNNCMPEARGQRTNTEGKLSLEVESLVEKIQE
jgi:hypothetical protein